MNYADAMKAVDGGSRMVRPGWGGNYVGKTDGGPALIDVNRNYARTAYEPTDDDQSAADWQIFA